jgi:hypothetical protein
MVDELLELAQHAIPLIAPTRAQPISTGTCGSVQMREQPFHDALRVYAVALLARERVVQLVGECERRDGGRPESVTSPGSPSVDE